MKKERWIILLNLVLMAMWLPVLFSKLTDYHDFQVATSRQPIPAILQKGITFFLPILEAVVIMLLLHKKWRFYGFLFSGLLLVIFTFYIAFGIAGLYGKIPCGCGGVVSSLSFEQHIWFNLFFAGISFIGVLFTKNDQNNQTKKSTPHKRAHDNVYSPMQKPLRFFKISVPYVLKIKFPRKFALFPGGGI